MKTWFYRLLLFCMVSTAWAQSLTVTISPDRIYVGSAFQLQIATTGEALTEAQFTFSSPTTTLQRGSTMQSLNGRTTYALTYLVQPSAEGVLTLTHLEARTASGKTLTATDHPTIRVQPIKPDPDLTLTLTADRTDLMPGDTFSVQLEIRARALVDNGQLRSPFLSSSFFGGMSERLPQVSFQFQTTDDAPIELLAAPKLVASETEGEIKVWVLRCDYRARREGTFHFPAPTLYDTRYRFTKERRLASESCASIGKPLTVEVKLPPLAGRPANYTGALASHFTAHVALNTLKAKTGDPIQLHLTLLTDGDPSFLRPPTLPEMEGFRTYGDPSRESFSEGCRYTYNLRPLRDGLLEIPALTLGWYDRAAQRYQTLTTPPLPLRVLPSAQLILAGEDGAEAVDQLPPPVSFAEAPPFSWYPSPVAFWALLAALLAFLVRVLGLPLYRNLVRPLLNRRASRRPVLHALRQLRRAQTPDRSLACVRRALNRPALTVAELRQLLADAPEGDTVADAFDQLQRAAYTTGEDVPAARETLARHLPEVMKRLALLLMLLLPIMGWGADSFLRRQAIATTLNATSTEAYADAAALWTRLAEGELRTAPHTLNAAICAYLAGDLTAAAAHLKTYELCFGRTAASERLHAALAARTETPIPQWPTRPLTSAQRAADILCMTAAVLLLMVALLGKRLRPLTILFALLWLLFALQWLLRLPQ